MLRNSRICSIDHLNGLFDHGLLAGLDTGSDHSYINQNVTTAGTPSFARLDVDNLRLDGNVLSSISGDIYITPSSGPPHIYLQGDVDATFLTVNTTLRLTSGSITDSGGTINFSDEHLQTTGNLIDGIGASVSIPQAMAAYDHSQDNTQAHSDYLLNTGDTATGDYTFNSPTFHIDSTNNNVGIGTTAPDSILHIKANVAGIVGSHPAGQLIIQDPDDTVFGNAVITGYESDGAGNPDQQLWYLGSSSSSNSNIIFLNRRNSKLQLGTNGASHLTILGNGNIGIGETSPQDKLEVNGTILVKDKLKFTQDDGNEYIDSLADGYMDYGATTGHRFNANVDITGTIRTTADQDWNLGAASAQADFAGDTKIRVTIGGSDYDIVALAVP